MYSLIALLAGTAAKLYDDLEDNNFLQKFRNNTLMEFLKGLHYISFTTLSVEEPMFFIIQYVMNIAHSFENKEGFSKPYEHSLLYSFVLLFFIIDYKKITSFCVTDKLLSIMFIVGAAFEPIAMKFLCKNSEYSSNKMNVRCVSVIIYIILYYFTTSKTLKYITAYIIGYLVISVLVQYYSLRIEKEVVKEEIKEEKEEIKEIVKEEIKEEKEEIKEIVKEEVKEEIKEVKEEKEEKEDEKKTQ